MLLALRRLMGWLDTFRRTSRQREPDREWWVELSKLRTDMDELERSTEALSESVLTNLRKLAKRAARAVEEDCGCKEETAAGPGGRPLSIFEARQRYGQHGGF